MSETVGKPSPEAKALSLFLMAYKTKNPLYKEQAKRINKRWDLVKAGELSKSDYLEEVDNMLSTYGGYKAVVEKTVRYYIDTTGKWTLKGDDRYCKDAKRFADTIMKK